MPAPVSPPLITTLSTPPQTTDIANFDARADTHVLETQALVPELNTANLNVYNNALSAYNSAIAAASSQSLASSSASNAATSESNASISAAAAAAVSTSLIATSSSSVNIGTGSKTFETQAGKQFIAGQFMTISSAANTANYMHGQVTIYSGSTLIINILSIGGSGTFSDWNMSVSGSQGAVGTTSATVSQTLTDAATVAWDWAAGRIGKVTLAGNRVIGLPSNLITDTFILQIVQDATGSRVPTWNAAFKWSAGAVQNPDPVAGRKTIYTGYYDGTDIHIGMANYGSR